MGTLAQDAVGLHGASQDDWELDRLVDILGPCRTASLAVEIGSDRGGTLWLWSMIGFDVIAVTEHTRADRQFNAHGATVIEGDSVSPVTRTAAIEAIAGRDVDMVFVDGGHDYFTAFEDIGWALELAPAGLVVVHDVNRNLRHPEIETYLAWLEYAETRPHMVIARGGDRAPGTGILFPRGT